VDEGVAELLQPAGAGATGGGPVRRDRATRLRRLDDVRNWACLLTVVPPRDLETFELIVVGPAYSASVAGRAAVAALRTEHCLVVSLLPLGPLVRQLGAAERARARWTRWRLVPRDVAATASEWGAAVAGKVRELVDAGFDGVYLDDLDLPFAHVGRPRLAGLIREARRAIPDHLLLAQDVDGLPGDVTFDALGPRGPLLPPVEEDDPAERWAARTGLERDPMVEHLTAMRARRDGVEPWRQNTGRQLRAWGFEADGDDR
jgi:hypothetical protein